MLLGGKNLIQWGSIMAFITFSHKGDFSKTEDFLKKAKQGAFYKHIDEYAKIGVEALREATPIDSGETAMSWTYETKISKDSATITWINTNENKGENIAILIQYGHGTGTGGYVHGRDFINPAMRPVFDKIAENLWKEVTEL